MSMTLRQRKLWHYANLGLFFVLWAIGAIYTYPDLKAEFDMSGWPFFIFSYVFIDGFFALVFLTIFIYMRRWEKPNSFRIILKVTLFLLVAPLYAFPLLVIAFDIKFGILLLLLSLASFCLQRLDWTEIRGWLDDAYQAFTPHLKAGYRSFQERRADR